MRRNYDHKPNNLYRENNKDSQPKKYAIDNYIFSSLILNRNPSIYNYHFVMVNGNRKLSAEEMQKMREEMMSNAK